jgi:hypothetical protein
VPDEVADSALLSTAESCLYFPRFCHCQRSCSYLPADQNRPCLNKFLKCWFLVLGILYGVQDKFPDDVLGVAVGPIFNGHKLERK